MKKWRISKLKINGFKVFSSFEEEYKDGLVIYDGPNGFGKTSLFDAKQLLFRGQLPRIAARLKPVTPHKHSFKSNLYRHSGYTGDISIVAELSNGNENFSIMRKADAREMKAKNNKPSEFSIFKLYRLSDFDDLSSAIEIDDEASFWQEFLGDNFQKNFDVLNYLQQDSKPLIIPDGSCDDTTRTKQIEHLINLDELNERLDKLKKVKVQRKILYDKEYKKFSTLKSYVKELEKQLSTSSKSIEYSRLTTSESVPIWDSKDPLTAESLSDYLNQLEQINLLKILVKHSEDIAVSERNKKKSAFLQTDEFALAVRLVPHIEKLEVLRGLSKQRKPLVQIIKLAKKNASDIHETDLPLLKDVLAKDFDEFSLAVKQKGQLQAYQNTIGENKAKALELRNRLKNTISERESICPLCGFDYAEQQLLIDAINVQTQQIEGELSKNEKVIAKCVDNISKILQILIPKLDKQLEKIDSELNCKLLEELETHKHQNQRLVAIAERIRQLNIILPNEYVETMEQKSEQVEIVRRQIQQTFEPESNSLSAQAYALYYSSFKNPEELSVITQEKIENKLNYLHSKYNNLISVAYKEKQKKLNSYEERLEAISNVEAKLKTTERQLNFARNTYINQTLGEIELLFHIYSGRLLQNIQTGLGIFLERAEGSQQDTPLQFKTAKNKEHDAALSMSSGQISALALALFLALNKKYAKTAFVFIDDPTQCMDEINIASLSDLLRVELQDRQVIMSTHEQDIANYLIYRYSKAGLAHQKINLLSKYRSLNANQVS